MTKANPLTKGQWTLAILDLLWAAWLVTAFFFAFRLGSVMVLIFAALLAMTHAAGFVVMALRHPKWPAAQRMTSISQLFLAFIVVALLVNTSYHITAVYGHMSGGWNFIFLLLALLCIEVFAALPIAKLAYLRWSPTVQAPSRGGRPPSNP